MLDVRRLCLLRELARHGTIAATARQAGYTRSAVSQQLAVLERETGVALLERDGRRVLLTPLARTLVDHTERLLAELDAAQTEIDSARAAPTGPLTIGAFASAAVALVVPVIAELAHRHPLLRPALREVDIDPGLAQLRSGDLDLLIVKRYTGAGSLATGGLHATPLLDDPVLIVLPARHPLAGRRVRLDALADEPWIAGTAGTTFGELVTTTCRANGFEPRIAHRADEVAIQLALVAAGLGAAMLPALAYGQGRSSGTAGAVTDPPLARQILALTRQATIKRPSVAAALAALAGHAAARPARASA
jgi:DNA-binding transcriptional LysR family regulator